MERITLRHRDALRAVETLRSILEEPFSVIVRDAAIQRFEYSFEAFWKFIKDYIKEKEGIICHSPKSCFRAIFSAGIVTEDETVALLEMTDDRNMTSHTYKEEVSRAIYGKLKKHLTLMENALGRVSMDSR